MSRDEQWYFAYGSNLSIERKQSRTGPLREYVRCYLERYRLAFNKRHERFGVAANIIPDKCQRVWGVVYRCDDAALAKLDREEGVANGNYRRETVRVVTDGGESFPALTYVAGLQFVCAEGRPSPEYLNYILTGAEHHGLPDEYVRQIVELAGAGMIEAGR